MSEPCTLRLPLPKHRLLLDLRKALESNGMGLWDQFPLYIHSLAQNNLLEAYYNEQGVLNDDEAGLMLGYYDQYLEQIRLSGVPNLSGLTLRAIDESRPLFHIVEENLEFTEDKTTAELNAMNYTR